MKRIILSFLLICILIIGTVTASYAIIDEELMTGSNEEENLLLLEDCLAEYAQQLKQEDDISLRWGSGNENESNPGTHGFIASQGLTIVESNNATLNSFFTTTRKKNIIIGSFTPDITGASALWKDHFYNSDGTGLWGSPTSAYDMFRAHYYGAVANYEAGNTTEAMKRLGMALHYISDINQPHHSSGVAAGLTGRHKQYEDWVEARYLSYKVSSMTTNALLEYKGKSLLTIANASASYSRGYIAQAKSSDTSDMQTATNATLKRAQRDAAGVIYKFAKEVGII